MNNGGEGVSEEPATWADPVALARNLESDNGKLRAYAVGLEEQIARLTKERDEANHWRHVHLEETRDLTRRLESALSDFQIAHAEVMKLATREKDYLAKRENLVGEIEELRKVLRAAMDERDEARAERNDLLEKYESTVEDFAASVTQADRYYDAMRALARIVAEGDDR